MEAAVAASLAATCAQVSTRLLHAPGTGRHVLVVGGGPLAAHAADEHVRRGHEVVVTAPWLSDPMFDLLAEHSITWRARWPEPGDVEGAWVVHAVSGVTAVDRMVKEWVRARRDAEVLTTAG